MRKAFWPLVAVLGVLLALGALSGGNFGPAPAEAVIDTVSSKDERPAVWYSIGEDLPVSGSIDCTKSPWKLLAAIVESDGVFRQDDSAELDENDVIRLETEGENSVWICVRLFEGDLDVLEFDANDYGSWEECFNNSEDGDCEDVTGLGTDRLQVDCDDEETCEEFDCNGTCVNESFIAALFVCEDDKSGEAEVTIQHGEDDDAEGEMQTQVDFRIFCYNEADEGAISCAPCTVEIVPALGSTQYSLIWVKLLDEDGEPSRVGADVTWTTDNCEINDDPWVDITGSDANRPLVLTDADDDFDTFDEIIELFRDYVSAPTPANAEDIHDFVDDFFDPDWDDESEDRTFIEEPFDSDDPFEDTDTFTAVILNCGQGHDATPGVAEVCAIVEVFDDPDLVFCKDVLVVGGPATVTVAADQTSVRCGERVQITVTVKDAKGENVSDHTLIEAVTNFGGVLGGTGAVAGQQGLVVPVSSTLAETIKGVATFWLLTSDTHVGPYEVLIATGGGGAVAGTFDDDEDEDEEKNLDDEVDEDEDDEIFDLDDDEDNSQRLGGLFSTGVITGRVQVACTLPAPAAPPPAPVATVRAPSTGQGFIQPPNTGDAGLADSSGSSWALFVIGGAAAFALAGAVSFKLARR